MWDWLSKPNVDLVIGIVVTAVAISGLFTGKTFDFYRTVRRQDNSTMYWVFTIGSLILGICIITLAALNILWQAL